MSPRVLAALVVTAVALGWGACARPPPARAPCAAEAPADGGLPLPPRSAKKGIIVPSDMGLGEGPSGPASTSGTSPAESPALGAPKIGN